MHSDLFDTVLAGVLVFVVGQIVVRFFLDPISKFKGTIGKIDNRLKFYGNAYGLRPPENQSPNSEAWKEWRATALPIIDAIRDLSCELESEYKQVPLRWLFIHVFRIIPNAEKVGKTGGILTRLSNSVISKDPNWELISTDQKDVRKNLRIPELPI